MIRSKLTIAMAAVVLGCVAGPVPLSLASETSPSVEYVANEDVVAELPLLEGPHVAFIDSVVTDEAHGHVFVGGLSGAGLVAVDLDGSRAEHAIDGIDAVASMVLMPGGHELAVGGSGAVTLVDTTTLRIVRRLPLGSDVSLTVGQSLAPVSGLIFFAYSRPFDSSGYRGYLTSIGALDPATGRVSLSLVPDQSESSPTIITPIPGQDAFVASFDSDYEHTVIYDATGGLSPAVTPRAQYAENEQLVGIVSPDGREFIAPSDTLAEDDVYSTADFRPLGHFDTTRGQGLRPIGLAMRTDGTLMSTFDAPYTPDLLFYRRGAPATPERIVDYGLQDPGVGEHAYSEEVVAGTAAFGATDGYVVTLSVDHQHPELRRVRPQPDAGLTMSVDQADHAYDSLARVTVTLGSPTSNRQVAVFLTPVGESRRYVGGGTVDSGGQLHLETPLQRDGTLEASFGGDATYPAGSVSVPVNVRARVSVSLPGARRHAAVATVRTHRRVRAVARVESANPHGCLTTRIDRWTRGAWKVARAAQCSRLDAGSRTSLVFRLSRPGRFRVAARFLGSAANSGSGWVYPRCEDAPDRRRVRGDDSTAAL